MSDLSTFTVGPPDAVTDSRLLPAVTAGDESGFVHGADVEEHPDNRPLQAGELDVGITPDTSVPLDETLPLEAELDDVVAGLDVDAVDSVGFDAVGFGAVDPVDLGAAGRDAADAGGAR